MKKIAIRMVMLGVIAAGAVTGCAGFLKEHQEAENVVINDIDFSILSEGDYTGHYDGGMYGWRENEVLITVAPGRVEKIKLVRSKEFEQDDSDYARLAQRVIEAQKLQVDVLSGATLTSKAHLKAMELALTKAK